MWCFVDFGFEMCFAPRRRTLFEHLDYQKCSEPFIFFTLLASKCASRHNGVHLFDIAASKSAPRLRCFMHFDFGNVLRATTACDSSSLVWPAGSAPAALASLYFSTLRSHKLLEKHSLSRLSYLFAHLHLLSSETFSF